MHPVSILTFGIFFAGYITARWDLVTRLYELAIFAWDHGVIVSSFQINLYAGLTSKESSCYWLRHSFPLLRSHPYTSQLDCY